MFTGLIEATGKTREIERIPHGLRFAVVTDLARKLNLGDSIAVNGVCLTVTEKDDQSFTAEISTETIRVTTLAKLRASQIVNLERPIAADGRLGGHFVLGHVDGVGSIACIEEHSDFCLVSVSYPESLNPYIVLKGSLAIDGISLTVAGLDDYRATVQVVPYTWLHTNLQSLNVDDPVNIECDIIGKHVVRVLRETT